MVGRAALGNPSEQSAQKRLILLWLVVFLFGGIISFRLFWLQVVRGEAYYSQAVGQQTSEKIIYPARGVIYLNLKSVTGENLLYPLASNRQLYILFADPKLITQPHDLAAQVVEVIGPDLPENKGAADFSTTELASYREQTIAALEAKMKKTGSRYELLRRRLTKDQADKIRNLKNSGLGLIAEENRYYPSASEASGQLLGYVGFKNNERKGFYGLEGYWDEELAGTPGEMKTEKDASGRLIAVGELQMKGPLDGASLILTIDQTIQHFVCQKIAETVQEYGATGGTVIVQEPKTGAIVAMCSYPDYNPAEYSKVKDISVFNNPAIFFEYEPGSVFKAITVAAGLNEGKIQPESTYNDNAPVKIGPETIENSDHKSNGIQTMTQVLEKSLNTGVIYIMRQITPKIFTEYVKRFGFGELSGIEMNTEVKGNISSLKQKGEIYPATASFGQGITATPLQLVNAYSAIANGGVLMKPYIVKQINYADGQKKIFSPQVLREAITSHTAQQLTNMLVSVVQNGHGKKAGVPGYLVGGKTGTAQIALKNGGGYETNANIGTFIGFAPADQPKFTMLVKIDRPKGVQYAESSAAPLFGTIAKFLLSYYQVAPNQAIK